PAVAIFVISFAVSFFFQAEDGIRDLTVTGVQTCALPISLGSPVNLKGSLSVASNVSSNIANGRNLGFIQVKSISLCFANGFGVRSEERRVGKECKYRCWSFCV